MELCKAELFRLIQETGPLGDRARSARPLPAGGDLAGGIRMRRTRRILTITRSSSQNASNVLCEAGEACGAARWRPPRVCVRRIRLARVRSDRAVGGAAAPSR